MNINDENNEIAVSVFCLAFNHEKFIARCLDGFVTQETNFKFEVLVHDDCSSDATPEIIRAYAEKYPDIIKPILEKKNQFSKGVSITRDIVMPIANGRYYAFCEGDDYWCDEDKLQRQFDYMEIHPECSMCVHNTLRHDLDGKCRDFKINNWKDVHIMQEEDVFIGWNVHFSSYFIRKEFYYKPKYKKKYWFGDYITLLHAYDCGEIVCLPYIMSVYNFNNHVGITYQNTNSGYEKIRERELLRKDFLLEFDEYTCHKYTKVIARRIEEIECMAERYRLDGLIHQKDSCKEEVLYSAQQLEKSSYTCELISQAHGVRKLKLLYRYHGYKYGYGIWRMILKSR